MQLAPKITFRSMDKSPALEKKIIERVEQLEQFHPRITSCNVVVSLPHRSQKHGGAFEVAVDLLVPGHEIVVTRASPEISAHDDPYVAVRDAFNDVVRQLEDIARKTSSHRTRQPGVAMQGAVDRLFRDEGFGFLTTLDNQDVYFNLDRLHEKNRANMEVGTKVRFVIGESDTGPYAHSITPLVSAG